MINQLKLSWKINFTMLSTIISILLLKTIATTPPGSDIQDVTSKTLLQTGPKGSLLYSLDSAGVYDDAPLLLDLLAPTSFDQGYDSAFLLGPAMTENYNSLMIALLGDEWWEPKAVELISKFLDWQWENYLGVEVPSEYHDELKGMTEGGKTNPAVTEDIGQLAIRGIVLANLPGTLTNIKYILKDEKENPPDIDKLMLLIEKISSRWSGLTCSMFGVWGSRTEKGSLFTGRNLDWVKDAGISKYKLITVHRPPASNDGTKRYAHATVSWAGIWGAITGMSSQGITVHEANLESNDITFSGFPWILRLRHIMTYARNIDDALALWTLSNNTVGFNHGFGSAADRSARVLETMKGNTAVFADNDPREVAGLIVDGQQIGAPRTEAVYRTNHGYDEYTIEHFAWNGTGAYEYSVERYMLFPQLFDSYFNQSLKITIKEAINITAIVGDKGDDHLFDCSPPHSGASNILSVTFDPENLLVYAAWENGHGDDNWTPAACNTYLKVDMNTIF